MIKETHQNKKIKIITLYNNFLFAILGSSEWPLFRESSLSWLRMQYPLTSNWYSRIRPGNSSLGVSASGNGTIGKPSNTELSMTLLVGRVKLELFDTINRRMGQTSFHWTVWKFLNRFVWVPLPIDYVYEQLAEVFYGLVHLAWQGRLIEIDVIDEVVKDLQDDIVHGERALYKHLGIVILS